MQVCHHYLVPLLTQIPLDASLLKRDTVQTHGAMGPPDSMQEKIGDENGEMNKDSNDPLLGDVSQRLRCYKN